MLFGPKCPYQRILDLLLDLPRTLEITKLIQHIGYESIVIFGTQCPYLLIQHLMLERGAPRDSDIGKGRKVRENNNGPQNVIK